MNNLTENYRHSIYSEVAELSKGKIYIVKNSLDDKIYIKKILEAKNYFIYEKMKNLSIDNIPKIYELIKIDDKLIVIEEYINGSSLKEILTESNMLSQGKVLEYALELIDILEKFHSCNPPIIHKDINPSNIMINNDGILKLIDFDISRIHNTYKSTDTNILGTYGYAAPEQFGFNQTDARTDIFSFGVTMNVMLVGKLPNEKLYEGKLSKIISKCIELDPDKRYQNINELKNELLRLNIKGNNENNNHVYAKLPGFRSTNLIIKILAFLWYLLLAMISLGYFYKEPIPKNRIMDIVISLFLLLLTLLYGNFNNIKSKIPILRSQNILIKILGYIVYTLLLFILFAIITPN